MRQDPNADIQVQLEQFFLQSSGIFLLLQGPGMTIRFVNQALLDSWGKDWDIVGKDLLEVLPELKDQSFPALLQQVYTTGVPYHGNEEKARIIRRGILTDIYYNYVYQAMVAEDGSITGVSVMATEVTEQVEARQSIAESEKRFRAFVTASSGVVYRMSPDWGEMRELEGKGFLSDTGEPDPDWLNKYILPQDQDRVRKTIDGAIRTKGIFELEHQVLRADGTLGWTFSRAVPITNSAGDIVEWFGAANDITDRKNAEAALSEAQEAAETQKRFYETIIGNTPDLIYVFDRNYRFTYANAALLTMWGKTPEEAIGKGLLENGYEPWHAQMHEREIDEVIAHKRPIRGDVSFPHATLGRRVYDYILVPVLNERGEVEAIAGTTRDITEMKRANDEIREREQRFMNLADDSPMFVFIIDPEANAPVNYWNRTWLQYTGQSPEEASGNGWNGIIHPDDIATVMGHYTPAFEHQEAYFIPAVRVKRHDGIYRWHAFKGNPRYAADGTFYGYVGVGLDIHEQKINEDIIRQNEAALQQKVEERTRELQRSNEDLQQFAHVASHDLKEPLRKIRTFGNRILEEFGELMPEKVQTYLGKMDNAAERMHAMINGVLLYSSLQPSDDVFEPVDLTAILQNIESDLEMLIQEKAARIVYHDLPSLYGSPVLLQQLFYNLVNNSLKFSRPDTAPVISILSDTASVAELEKAQLTSRTAFVKIVVSDTGIGFDQRHADKIFQTFSRLHSKDQYEGTGLGLALCKKIVERHGGAIYADGEKGQGAQFTVLLPQR